MRVVRWCLLGERISAFAGECSAGFQPLAFFVTKEHTRAAAQGVARGRGRLTASLDGFSGDPWKSNAQEGRLVKRVPLLLLLAGCVAIVCATGSAAAARSASAPEERTGSAKTCPRGYVHAVINRVHRCLRAGQKCVVSADRQYHRYGFHCHRGKLTRTGAQPSPPAPVPPPPPPAPPPPPPPPPPPATTAHAGHYSGTTSDGKRVVFEVSNDLATVRDIEFDFDVDCPPEGGLSGGFGFSDPFPIRGNAFAFEFEGTNPAGQTGTYSGSFEGSFGPSGAATGRLRVLATITAFNPPWNCDTGFLSWSASFP